MSSGNKEKTQKISTVSTTTTAGVTAFITKIFQSSKTSALPIYKEDSELSVDRDTDDSENIEKEMNLRDVGKEFEFKHEIAAGGQGTIRTALDKNFKRTVAIKSLNEDLKENETARAAFINEAVMTAKLEHPAIVPIHGIYKDDQKGIHLSMKLVNGKTLKTYLKVLHSQYRNLTRNEIRKNENSLLQQKLEFVLRVCSAVSFLHKKNIIHRDLKPENIMIGDYNETYIMDLGIAIRQDSENFRKNLPAGTPQYIAPEIVSGEIYDHRSDIFLLGLIIYELFCIAPAYPSLSMEETLSLARQGKINPIRHEYGIEIHKDLQYIIKKATMRKPEERYQTVDELANDIQAFMIFQPVKANPHVLCSYLKSFLIRRYRLLIGITLIALLLFFVSVGYIYQKNALDAEEKNHITQVSANLISSGVLRVTALNDRIRQFENLISQLTVEAGARLTSSPDKGSAVFHTPGNPPAGLEQSETYGEKIHLDHLVFLHPDQNEKTRKEALQLQMMKKSFYRILCDSRYQAVFAAPGEIKYKLAHQKCAPFHKVYIGLRSGLHVSYPYTMNYAPDYDPRNRPWFKLAVSAEGKKTVWSQPYKAASSDEIVITCSRKILSPINGSFLGVGAADISVNALTEMLLFNLKNNFKRPQVYLLDQDGIILLDTKAKNPRISLQHKKFPHDHILRNMNLSGCGQFNVMENEKKIFYFFMRIPSLNWIYVERYDYDRIMNKYQH